MACIHFLLVVKTKHKLINITVLKYLSDEKFKVVWDKYESGNILRRFEEELKNSTLK